MQMEKDNTDKGRTLQEHYMTVKEVAAHFRVTPQSIYSKLNNGRLGYCRMEGRVLIPVAEVQKLITNGTAGGKK